MQNSIFSKLLSVFFRESGRIGFLLVLVCLLLWLGVWLPRLTHEAALSPLLTSAAMVLALAGLSHCTRRVLFPRLDLQEIAIKATEHPIGAAIVFLGISMVLSVLIYANVSMLR
jgi:hypothetical protein